MRVRQFFYKLYPLRILLYLLIISLLYVHFNNSFITAISFIPLVYLHSDPVLLFKEILSNLIIKNNTNSIEYQNGDYKKAVQEILKEHNLNFDIKIKNDERINAFSGFSTITITTGFMNHFPLNDEQDKLKILPVLGHEITHQKREKSLRKELIFYFIPLAGLFILFGKAVVPVIQFFVVSLGLLLLICYLSRRDELEADKGGCELAKDTTWMIEFLKFMDKRKEKSYNLWDWFDELFRFHPNPVNRIQKLEKMELERT